MRLEIRLQRVRTPNPESRPLQPGQSSDRSLAAFDVLPQLLAILAGGGGAAVQIGGRQAVDEVGGVSGGTVRLPGGDGLPEVRAPGLDLARQARLIGYVVLLIAALVSAQRQLGLSARLGEAQAPSLAGLVGQGVAASGFQVVRFEVHCKLAIGDLPYLPLTRRSAPPPAGRGLRSGGEGPRRKSGRLPTANPSL